MANVFFMAHGIKLWADYTDHGDNDIEIKYIMIDGCNTDIEPLIGSDVIELAYQACEVDVAEITEYLRECTREMRYYDEQN